MKFYKKKIKKNLLKLIKWILNISAAYWLVVGEPPAWIGVAIEIYTLICFIIG